MGDNIAFAVSKTANDETSLVLEVCKNNYSKSADDLVRELPN